MFHLLRRLFGLRQSRISRPTIATHKSTISIDASERPRVAASEDVIVREELPLPFVFYPSLYGAFIGFSKTIDGSVAFCSCARTAIENYIQYRALQRKEFEHGTARSHVIDSKEFPTRVLHRLIAESVPNTRDVLRSLYFEDGVCHECNKAVPTYRYCREQYGSKLMQSFGWYLKKRMYQLGVFTFATARSGILPNVCPREVLDIVDVKPGQDSDERAEIELQLGVHQERQILKHFEELARETLDRGLVQRLTKQRKRLQDGDFFKKVQIETLELSARYHARKRGRRVEVSHDGETMGIEEFVWQYFERGGYTATYFENAPIVALFCVLMWPLIHDRSDPRVQLVRKASTADWVAGRRPSEVAILISDDFGKPSYAARRARQIDEHLDGLLRRGNELPKLYDEWRDASEGLRDFYWTHPRLAGSVRPQKT